MSHHERFFNIIALFHYLPQVARISIPRNGKWLLLTWEEYTKPKYKDALSRWNKETGGGDGTLPSFHKYACSPWFAWVFCLGSEFDFLLASSSEGRVPSHLSSEGGWETAPPVSDETDESRQYLCKDRDNLSSMMTCASSLFDKRVLDTASANNQRPTFNAQR